MQYAAESSAYSAATIVRTLRSLLPVTSVLDVGCAYGTWVRTWMEAGVQDATGIDGDYVDQSKLEISKQHFLAHDLNLAFSLGRQFDLVQSLEVGEHIAPSSSDAFVASIAGHSATYVVFSAAPPGQGGEFHINEQPYEFWRRKFESHGFIAIDAIRKNIINDGKISYWYRYNTLLFVRNEKFDSISETLKRDALNNNAPVDDISPPLFKLRKAMIRALPMRVQHEVARLKARILPTGRF